jgi:hypothetical protein
MRGTYLDVEKSGARLLMAMVARIPVVLAAPVAVAAVILALAAAAAMAAAP